MIAGAFGIERSVKVVGLPKQAVSAAKFATGFTLMVICFEIVSKQLLTLVTLSFTVYVPDAMKVCCGF